MDHLLAALRKPVMAGNRAVAVATAAALLVLTAPSRAQEKKLPTPEEVLGKYIDALGGKAALEKLRNRVATATMEMIGQGAKGTLTEYAAAPDLVRTKVEVAGRVIESGTDGKVFWRLAAPTPAQILEGEEKVALLRKATFNAALHWRKLFPKAEVTGTDEVNGKPVWKVLLTPAEGSTETWYIEQDSGLRVKSELTMKTARGNVTVEVYFTDYRKTDGVLIPYQTTQTVMGQLQVLTFESIRHNVEIPKERFELPDEVKTLLQKRSEPGPETQATRPAGP